MMKYTAYMLLTLFLALSLGAQAAELQPHRAYYSLSLVKTPSSDSAIRELRGTMMMELQKECGGWTIHQLSQTWITTTDGKSKDIKWGYVVWESDNSQNLTFNTYRKEDGELTEEYRGRASLKGRDAKYSLPREMLYPLSDQAVFPVQHLKELLNAARKQEVLFSRNVFDGSSDRGSFEVSSFISPLETSKNSDERAVFSDEAYYPVHLAIYNEPKGTGLPEYETQQELMPNGIIRSYTLLYPKFQVKGTLERIELLSDNECE